MIPIPPEDRQKEICEMLIIHGMVHYGTPELILTGNQPSPRRVVDKVWEKISLPVFTETHISEELYHTRHHQLLE